jgi:predicted TIM-barrel fold metal-dependent hydrolase
LRNGDVTVTVADEVLGNLKIIDCDSHFTEPADLWSSRTPAKFAERMPVMKTVDGVTGWFMNGELWASMGGNTIRTGAEKTRGRISIQLFDEIDKASWDVAARLDLIDSMGIYAQILYPNGIGFNSNHVMAIEDKELRLAVLQTFNDFNVDVQHESGDRLFPQPILPVWDMDLTIREMTRLIDKGIRGFTVSDKPELMDLPELPEPYWAPMWDLFNESRAVVNFHISSGARPEKGAPPIPNQTGAPKETPRPVGKQVSDWRYWDSFGPQRKLALGATLSYMSNARIINNLCMSDMFDRYPNLKVVSAESGIGWIPFILEALEWQLDEFVTDPTERAQQQRRPTEYFRDHIFATFWFETVGPTKLIEDIGVNNVLVETDIPHPTCLYPGGKEHLASVLANWDPAIRRRVLQDNAAELYRLPI